MDEATADLYAAELFIRGNSSLGGESAEDMAGDWEEVDRRMASEDEVRAQEEADMKGTSVNSADVLRQLESNTIDRPELESIPDEAVFEARMAATIAAHIAHAHMDPRGSSGISRDTLESESSEFIGLFGTLRCTIWGSFMSWMLGCRRRCSLSRYTVDKLFRGFSQEELAPTSDPQTDVIKWHTEFAKGLEAVSGLLDEQRKPLGGEYPWNVSMYESETRSPTGDTRLALLYVKWTSPSQLLGRKLRVDDDGSFIYPTPANPLYAEVSLESTDFVKYVCIHPDLGVTPTRFPKNSGLRTSLPHKFSRLSRIYVSLQSCLKLCFPTNHFVA
jgi:hypothetical protein